MVGHQFINIQIYQKKESKIVLHTEMVPIPKVPAVAEVYRTAVHVTKSSNFVGI